MGKNLPKNKSEKQDQVAILISGKLDLKTKLTQREREGCYILIEGNSTK